MTEAPGLPAELEAAMTTALQARAHKEWARCFGAADEFADANAQAATARAALVAKLLAWRKAAYLAGFKAGSGDDCYDEAML